MVSSLAFAQEKPRTVEKFQFSNEPIELTDISIASKKMNSDETILFNNTWLKELSLNIHNGSGKNIIYMEIELEIAPSGKMQLPVRLPIKFGKMPDFTSEMENFATESLLESEERVSLSLTKKNYEWLSKFMLENEVENIDKVTIYFEFVLFDDYTAWSKGFKMKRNSKNPSRWDAVKTWIKAQEKILSHS
jgi:hypothetical protein